METSLTAMDLFWFFFTTALTVCAGLLCWIGNAGYRTLMRMEKKVTEIVEMIGDLKVDQEHISTRLEDHIENVAIHCNYPECGRRISNES